MQDRPCTLPWHHVARRMAAEGVSQWTIAAAVSRSRSAVQQFLNPYSHAKAMARSRQRYREDPEYRARVMGKAVEDLKPLRKQKIITKGFVAQRVPTQHREPTMPWHFDAIRHQGAGFNYEEIAKLVGKSASTVRCFLDVEAREQWAKATAVRLRRKYAEDDEYRERHKARVRESMQRSRAARQQVAEATAP
jgi:predicted transcriptional regulator